MTKKDISLPRLNKLALLLLVILAACPVFILFILDIFQHNRINDGERTYLLGRDFINYYSSSVLVKQGELLTLFDIENYRIFQRYYFEGSKLNTHSWSYPPHYLLFTLPLSFFPYFVSLFIWTTLGLIAVFKATKLYTLNSFDAWVIILTPASLICFVAGQNGMFSAALMIAPFILKDKHPRLAGVLLGFLTYKPQLGMLIPIAFILMRDWKVIFWASLTTMTLIMISIALFGLEPWMSFIHDVIPSQVGVLTHMGPPFAYMIPSLFKSVHLFGVDQDIAMFFQTTLSALLIILVLWAFWRHRNYKLQLACLFTSILLFTPYIVIYDMVPLALAVYLYYIYLVSSDIPITRIHIYFMLLVVSLPLSSFALSWLGIHLAPLILLIFLGCIIQQLRQSGSQSRDPYKLPKLKDIF